MPLKIRVWMWKLVIVPLVVGTVFFATVALCAWLTGYTDVAWFAAVMVPMWIVILIGQLSIQASYFDDDDEWRDLPRG